MNERDFRTNDDAVVTHTATNDAEGCADAAERDSAATSDDADGTAEDDTGEPYEEDFTDAIRAGEALTRARASGYTPDTATDRDRTRATRHVRPTPKTDDRNWTMFDLRVEVDRFAAMLRASDKRHSTIAAYVTQAERFLNWLDGSYKPRTHRQRNPYGWKVGESRTKYQPLGDYLKGRPENAVRLTFAKIEDILGCPLPGSAFTYAQWWANDRTGNHTQAQAWLAAGRKVVQLDLIGMRVTFIRSERNYRPSAAAELG